MVKWLGWTAAERKNRRGSVVAAVRQIGRCLVQYAAGVAYLGAVQRVAFVQ